jgi:DNA-directed RNA polymerase sigma subunit (sigma70/sigma32)
METAIKNVSKKMKISEERIKKILEQEMKKLNKRTK